MTSEPKVAPYGEWTSPITAELVSGSNNLFNEVHVDPNTRAIYLVEGRPAEGGRCAIVKVVEGSKDVDVLPSQYSASSSVHEYGGGACAMGNDGGLIFTDASTRGVFRLKSPDDIQSIVDVDAQSRFANFDVHPKDPRWVLTVLEVHKGEDSVDNKVAVIDADAKTSTVLCEGADFYSHPKFSHDGKWICWVQWKHPDMPWTGSELYVATWKDGKIGTPKYVAGKAEKESISQPKWHSYGGLIFGSDRTGFQQIYLYDPVSNETRKVDIPGFEDADVGGPDMFQLGSSTYVELNPGTIVTSYTKNARDGLLAVAILSGHVVDVPVDFMAIHYSSVRRLTDSKFTVIASTHLTPPGLITLDLKTHTRELLRSTASIPVSPTNFSRSKTISFPRTYGEDKTGLSHAIFIPPSNPGFAPEPGTKPPLIVDTHGGPTFHIGPGLALTSQHWTSRGYAYVYVNYAGSSGYGRKYRESLNTFWGIKDVDDAASCVAHLASEGLVDGTRVGIRGQSSGGYTVLQALCVYPEVFASGTSLYGISNLEILAAGTHKFESHYLFPLMFAPGTSPEEQERILKERSPCQHAEKIRNPLLMLQGSLDKVVPLEQALGMEKILKEGGKDVELVVFEGEKHGFRQEKNVKRAIELEEALWKRTLVR